MKLTRDEIAYSSNTFNSVGVLLCLNNHKEINDLQKIVNFNFFKNKHVKFLTWFNPGKNATIPEFSNVVFINNSDFRDSLPSSSRVQEFCQQEFDLLIDLTLIPKQELQSITSQSKAAFKSGLSTSENSHVQFCIKPRNKKDNNILELLQHIQFYLEKIF